jgi:hypothetical protein
MGGVPIGDFYKKPPLGHNYEIKLQPHFSLWQLIPVLLLVLVERKMKITGNYCKKCNIMHFSNQLLNV